ncbi:MAG TPA: tetratricopeptide repeat protein, partial [Bryobacteraceae bacterium]
GGIVKGIVWRALAGCLLIVPLAAEPAKEQPVGLLLSSTGAKVLRANTETPLAARTGDILFAGDVLRTESSPASFLFCPARSSESLAPNGEVIFEAAKLKIKSGKIADSKPIASCFLPQLVRVAVASQQHYGVSMTRGLAKPDGNPVERNQLPADVQAELVPVERDISADPLNPSNLIAEATIFEKHKLEANALADYRKVAEQWKDAVWVRGRIFELEESLAAQAALAAAAVAPDAKTFALLIGISKYQKLPQDLWLQYAHADAATFAQHLQSGRGGGVPPENLLLLSNEQATTAAVRNAFQTFLRNRAGKKDTVFIMVAGHGTVDTKGSYILTYDSDPQDLSTTAIPMQEIQDLVQQELSKVGRVVLLADVCRAAAIGATKPSNVNAAVERLGEAQGEILGLMASRPKEVSYEGPQYGGGHGAFTYSVLKGLEGAADDNKDQSVNVNEIIEYVRTQVATLTSNKQHPRDFGNMDNSTPLSDLKKPGIALARYPVMFNSRNGKPLLLASAQQTPLSSDATRDVNAFEEAIRAGRVLPDQTDSAFTSLSRLQGELTPEQYFLRENELRIALENQAQQVLLRYLTGDQQPQSQQDFDAGSQYMEAATRLTPESLYLQGRRDFFRGRAMLFTKNYPAASDLLEQSVRIDPGAAYGYNALGISYLEQADFRRAIPAFRDASRRAPLWSYPLHNLALSYVESGDYRAAIRSYQQAMKITPQYSYLPYNLGLVYQRTNKRKEAEQSYRQAMSLAPDSAEPLNALGTLKAQEGKPADAEKLYRESLAKNANLLAARHNLALLLASNNNRQSEAIDLWRDNLTRNPDYIPSRLSLAETLAARGDTSGAITEYQAVVRAKPEYVAAHNALADLYVKNHDTPAAIEQLQQSAKLDPQSSPIYERIGDLQASSGHPAEARTAWQQALDHAPDKSSRKRLSAKIAGAAK